MSDLAFLTSLCWVVFSLFAAVRFAHILQLEHYHNDSYIKWVVGGGMATIFCRNGFDLALHGLIIASVAGIIFSKGTLDVELLFLGVGAIIWAGSHAWPSRALKKPFVYTPRAKRLLLTVLLISSVILSQAYPYGDRVFVSVLVILGYLQAFMIAAANQTVGPIEKYLQLGFKREAQKKLLGKKVIAVTGSYGKTGTKEAVAHMLETAFPILKTPGSYNTPMGICKTINERMEKHHEIFISEMGATRPGDIKELCDLVGPVVAIITSTGDAHLESFGSREAVAKTKFELADALPEDGLLIYNSDYELARQHAKGRPQKVITYGFEERADFMPLNLRNDMHGSTFDIKTPDGTIENVKIRLLGKLNVINVVAAFAAGSAMGLDAGKMKAAAATMEQVESRMQLIENRGSYLVINDGFNSNPVGAEAAVETLGFFEGYRKILVTPGIVDLGGKHEKANYGFGKEAAQYIDLALLINERRTKPLHDGLLDGGLLRDKIKTFASLSEALEFLEKEADEKSVVLFENDLPDHMEDF